MKLLNNAYKALLWKLWWSSTRKRFMWMCSVLIPITFVYGLAFIFFNEADPTKPQPTPLIKLLERCIHSSIIFPIDIFSDYIYDQTTFDILYTPPSPDADKVIGNIRKLYPRLNISVLKSAKNEEEMDEWFSRNNSQNGTENRKLGFGIIFKILNHTKMDFVIRSAQGDAFSTDMLFPKNQNAGPMDTSNSYFHEGFLLIQTAISLGFMNLYNISMDAKKTFIQRFPYPAYLKAISNRSQLLLFIFVIGFAGLFLNAASLPVLEKASGAREMMRINGLRTHMIHSYWFLFFFIPATISLTVMTILLKIGLGNGALLPFANPFILWLLVMLFCINSIFFMFCISSFFTNSKFSLLAGTFIWFISLFYFWAVEWQSSALSFLSTLLPVGGISKGLHIIKYFEILQEGISFRNLFYTPQGSSICMAFVMLGLLLGAVIFALVFVYIDAINPGKYGRAKHWHFIIPEFIKKMCRVRPAPKENSLPPEKTYTENAELPVGIEVKELTKIFDTLNAVNNLSMDIYQNQITALLGHNGAGKTTLLNILIGVYSPTYGEVIFDGYNVFENLDKFRQNFGYCPQDNLLLPDLSVLEHLLFIGMIKGLSMSTAAVNAFQVLEKFDLLNKKKVLVKKLSGGMKRKLCLAVSLINDPKILILDEPTSGLDPQSRRAVWDTLLPLRGNRTIIISTHFMEEADILGDWIAIMANGKMKCYGSSLYLKKHFGSSYHVKLTYNDNANTKVLEGIIKRSLPSTDIKITQRTNQIAFKTSMESTPNLSFLFLEIENSGMIKETGVSCSSMEDVFLKVQEGEGITTDLDEVDLPTASDTNTNRVSAVLLIFQQFFALILKRCLWIKKNWVLLILMIFIIPIFIAYITVNSSKAANNTLPINSLPLKLSSYNPNKVLLGGQKDNILVKAFTAYVKSQGSTINLSETTSTADELIAAGIEDVKYFRNNMIIAGDFLNEPIVFYSSIAYHSPPIALNTLFNTFIAAYHTGVAPNISVSNYPYRFHSNSCDLIKDSDSFLSMYWLFVCSGVLLVTTYFCIFPIAERITRVKHLQFMCGVNPIIYWFSMFLFDMLFACIIMTLILVPLYSFDNLGAYKEVSVIGFLTLVMFLFCVGSVLFSYLISFKCRTFGSGFQMQIWISILSAFASIIEDDSTNDHWLTKFDKVVPFSPYLIATSKIGSMADLKLQCKYCNMEPGTRMYKMCKYIATENNPLTLYKIKVDLITLGVQPLVYFLLILLLDFGFVKLAYSKFKDLIIGRIEPYMDSSMDADVLNEKNKVTSYRKRSNINDQDVLIVDSLGKKYSRNFTAVNDVTFTCKKGECFGLLGVNGAGKTTTFSMLTAIEVPSKGGATIQTLSSYATLRGFNFNYLKNISYCPQNNAILDDLTARQILKVFALLRGIPMSEVGPLAEKWIQFLDLHLVCDRPCGNYSGGNKRKLCAAIAFIGDPPVILLDEPTTGVDPVTRRKVWKILKQSQLKQQTIIITSHSMDECDAVCDRLAIMVKGYMKCIGPIQYLKHKFAQGFAIFIKIRYGTVESDLVQLKSEMALNFGNLCLLKDEHAGLLYYHLEDSSFKWSTLFSYLSSTKNKFDCIDDFMIGDNTLEQVFLSFAKSEEKM